MESTFISKCCEQLEWFAPRELITMGLIILNKVLKTYCIMLKLWWGTALFFIAVILEYHYHFIPVITLSLYSLFVLLVSRASVLPKNSSYILLSKKALIVLELIIIILVLNSMSLQLPESLRCSLRFLLGFHRDAVVLSPFLWLLALCLFDAPFTCAAQTSAVWRAGKIFLYHYLFFISVYLVLWYLIHPMIALVINLFGAKLIGLVACEYGAMLLWMPCYSAALIYGYIRGLREHMDYYY